MAKAPSRGTVTGRLEIYRRTVASGDEELFFETEQGVEKAVGGTGGGGSHAASHADGGADEVIDSGAPSTLSFGMTPDPGAILDKAAPLEHEHGMPANPVPAHEAAGDPHPVYTTDTVFNTHATRHADGGADPVDHDTLVNAGNPDFHHTQYHSANHADNAVDGIIDAVTAPTTLAFGQSPDAGEPGDGQASSWRHEHGMPANPVPAHEAAGDPHPGYALDGHSMASHSDEGALATKNTVGTTDIDNDAVTYAKIQNVTDARLLGRSAGSSGDAQEITIGANLTLSGGQLSGSGGAGADPPEGSYAPGSITIATGKFRLMADQIILVSTDVLTIEGTGMLRIC